MDLTDKQWELMEPLLPAYELSEKPRRGRPFSDARSVLDGVLWALRTGAPWADLPRRYPPSSTCHRRFLQWEENGVLDQILETLARDLEERGGIDLRECFVDGSFVPAKKGGPKSGKPSAAKAARSWQSETAMVFLSPSGWKVLLRMKSPSSKTR